MTRFVVLLRGVNVGKGNRVPMAEFRRLLEGTGYTGVRTLLNSGNAVFSSPGRSAAKHAEAIAAALREGLGVAVPAVVKSSDEYIAVVAGNPIAPPPEHHSRLLVAFAQDPGSLQELKPFLSLVQEGERFVIGKHAAYMYCAGGILESKVASALLGKAGRGLTTRNWATVLRLDELLHTRAA
jgi:uncharacterized protein (DUF1697 family)